MAATYSQVYAFTGMADGALPNAPVTFDSAGNLYGETFAGANICSDGDYGGQNVGCGTVYKINPAGQLTTLATFTGINGAQGLSPLTLVGNRLYGSTYVGGANDLGTLFSVGTNGSDFTILHQFSGRDGANPTGRLMPAPNGAFYGITILGGPSYSSGSVGKGVLFRLNRDGSLVLLHAFDGKDGLQPTAILADKAGTIYGSTTAGGTPCGTRFGCGTIFSYVPSSKQFTSLYQFKGRADGEIPHLGAVDSTGRLYGASTDGGAHGFGTLFDLTPSSGAYSFTTLHAFAFQSDGSRPESGPTLLPNGDLVGAAFDALYLYDPSIKGGGVALQSFPYCFVNTQPVIGLRGVIYGTTSAGGVTPCLGSGGAVINFGQGCGVIFSFSPKP